MFVLWQSVGLSRSAGPDGAAALVSSLVSLCHAMPAVLDMLVPDSAHPGWHAALALSPLPPQPGFKQAQQIRVHLALLKATNSLGSAAQVWLLNAMQIGLARSSPAVLADIWQAVLQTVQVWGCSLDLVATAFHPRLQSSCSAGVHACAECR